jgi:hypothetical protein
MGPVLGWVVRTQGVIGLKKASEYYQHARECHEMATRTSDPEQRAMLLKMAETWQGLAKNREQHIKRQQRIAAIENGSEPPTE